MDKTQCQQECSVSDSKGMSLETIHFSLEILKTILQTENSNVAFSPVSLYSLLSVLHQGSNGSSRTEMNHVLKTTAKSSGDSVKNFTANIQNSDCSPALKLVWKSRRKNESDVQNPQEVTCEEEQSPRCKLPCRSFGTLANMLCFNGFWSQEGSLTTEMDFCSSPEDQFQTEGIQMKKNCFCGVSEDIGAKWIHIPIAAQKKSGNTGQCVGVRPSCKSYWSRRKMSLMIMLPTERHGLNKLIQDLTPELFIKSFDYSPKDDRKNLELILPAFYVNSCTDFKAILRKMGLQSIFGNKSNLSDISAEQKLFLSNIKQKGEIVVDQFGARTTQQTETNFPSLFCEPWEEIEPCIVDEPFLFFIVDKETLLPLVAGKVSKPEPVPWKPLNEGDEFDDDFAQCQEF